eukprot:233175-Chlamydomonas_euryale.AAC.2
MRLAWHANPSTPARVLEAYDWLLALEVPHHGAPICEVGRQDVLHLAVPSEVGDLGAAAAAALRFEGRVHRRLRRLGNVPDAQVAVGSPRSQQVWTECVELQALDLHSRQCKRRTQTLSTISTASAGGRYKTGDLHAKILFVRNAWSLSDEHRHVAYACPHMHAHVHACTCACMRVHACMRAHACMHASATCLFP